MTQRILEKLGSNECVALLHGASVGRLAYADEDGPVVIPVNYAMADEDVVFRVEPGTKRAALEQGRVTFEVDYVDDVAHGAWSVLVRGTATEVDMDQVPALLHHMDGTIPHPWVAGVHSVWIKITPTKVTGRRLGAPVADTVF
jgi:uncharacterized protein